MPAMIQAAAESAIMAQQAIAISAVEKYDTSRIESSAKTR
jgi:hypothetical protein